MQFAVGDKVVHPYHGPGTITAIEHRELMEGLEYYFVIEIPSRGLTLHIPKRRMHETGVRFAMPQAELNRVLKTLRNSPDRLPNDYKERQDLVWEKLVTGRPILIAEVVRDLTWHEKYAHLTKKDSDHLDHGRRLLATEIALISDTDVAEANKSIEATLAAAMASASN